MIAYDNSTNGGQTGSTPSSKTYAHTTGSISDGVLYVSVHTQGTNGTTASQPTVTYNGTSMTFEEGSSTIGTSGKTWIYSLANPSSGSNNIVITAGATKAEAIASEAASYSGVDSANLYVESDTTAVNATTITTTVTPSGSGYWFGVSGTSQRALTVNSSTYTRRQPVSGDWILGDSNGTISGSTSAVTDIGSGGNVTNQIMWSFAPAGPTTVDVTIQAKARVLKVQSASVQAKARVQDTSEATIQARSRILDTSSATIQAKANIRTGGEYTIQAMAAIFGTQETDIDAKARILTQGEETIQGKANILVEQSATIQAKARTLVNQSATVQAKANVATEGAVTIQAKAAISNLSTATIQALAAIVTTNNKTIQAKAAIWQRGLGVITGVRRSGNVIYGKKLNKQG